MTSPDLITILSGCIDRMKAILDDDASHTDEGVIVTPVVIISADAFKRLMSEVKRAEDALSSKQG
jgi:hypothetical protein